MSPQFSVIIPSFNNKSEKNFSISYVIRSVLAQIKVVSEILVVDDSGSDETIGDILRLFPAVRIVRSERLHNNLGNLRNLGSSYATGEILVFIDDDTVLTDPHALLTLFGIMENNDFCCGANRYWTSIYWRKFIHQSQSVSSILRTLQSIAILPRGINKINGFRDLNEFTFIGNFGAIKRNVFEEIGRFREDFPGWGFEDTELMMRLCMADTRSELLYSHGISVIHLTHVSDIERDFLANMKKFNDLESERGFYFHVNHFFGVYEADGFSLLTSID